MLPLFPVLRLTWLLLIIKQTLKFGSDSVQKHNLNEYRHNAESSCVEKDSNKWVSMIATLRPPRRVRPPVPATRRCRSGAPARPSRPRWGRGWRGASRSSRWAGRALACWSCGACGARPGSCGQRERHRRTWDTVMPHLRASSSLASSLGYGLDRCE